MPAVTIWKGAGFEDSGASPMARVVGNDGENIVQADITTIFRTIHNAATGTVVQASTEITVADVVFDTLQTDSRWTYDATGYNFRDAVPAAQLATGSEVYQIEYKFTPDSGEVWHVVFQLAATALLGS
jgi:hypothetical protein